MKKAHFRRRRNEGSALLVVFWLMALLTLALFTSIQLVSSDLSLIASQKNDFRANQLCEMGIAVAANPVVQRYDPLLVWTNGQEGYTVRIRGEGGKININALISQQDRDFLERMFTFWGMPLEQAEELEDCLIDWCDQDDNKNLLGAESEYYLAQGLMNYPFNRPFYDLEEMNLVKGMEALNYYQPNWRNYFTLFSGGKLDLQEADAAMIMMCAEVTDITAQDFVVTRMGLDKIDGTEDDVRFPSLQEALVELGMSPELPQVNRLTVNDNTVRIESLGQVGDYQKRIVLVIRNRESNPQILNREEVFQ